MNFKIFISCLILFTSSFSQQTYFIKYKDYVQREILQEKISSQKIISEQLFRTSQINTGYTLNWFAKDIAKDIPLLKNILKITFTERVDKSLVESLAMLDTDIEYIEESHTYKIEEMPNDSLINEQWGLAKIKAFDAWNITEGADSVILAIIDTGIDYLHPDLKNKIFMNQGEIGLDALGRDKKTNNVDDDMNGFIDDYMGWDFVDRVGFPFDTLGGDFLNWDNDPRDDYGHGTIVSGIAGAETNNLHGIAGVAPKIRILNVRAFDPTGNGEEDDAAAAILYAVKMGCKVINMSFGDNSFSLVLRDVIRYAYSQNVVLVASSGNSGSTLPHYPSGYLEVICVGNSTSDDFVSSNSNYGSTLDLVAPGTFINATAKGNAYTVASGTSTSAPFVSAAAALILSLRNFSNEEVKQILKSTSDDIGQPGWDLRSGAGRINLLRALTVLAPAQIKFHHPFQDFATNKDTLKINISAISPQFLKYDLYVGNGLNPVEWTIIKSDQRNQLTNSNVHDLSLSPLSEGEYCLRLVVTLTNGYTTEERVNFYIIRSAPVAEVVGIGPSYFGNSSTIVGELYTSQRCIARMYYKKFGETSFKFISLDGFNTNNQFVKQFHYGIIPKSLIESNTVYEIYFEAENLSGIKSVIKDGGNYFQVGTDPAVSPISFNIMDFKLPKGDIYDKPLSITTSSKNEVLIQQFYESQDLYYSLYKLEGNAFVKHTGDSLKNKYPRFVGDINNNDKVEVVSSNRYDGFIDEQTAPGSFSFNNIVTDSSGDFFPIFADDINGDGSFELITNFQNSKYIAYKVNGDLSLSLIDTLKNYSSIDSLERSFGIDNSITNNVITADVNNDGIKELWFLDTDGDLMSYKFQQNNLVKGDSIIEKYSLYGLYSNSITSGDYNGDGIADLAVLYSIGGNFAPLFLVNVYGYQNNRYEILFQKVFVDQSSEFIGFTFNKAYQSIKLADLDNDTRAELIVNVFPNTYIFQNNSADEKLVFFKDGINNNNVFIGDLNENGISEIAFQESDGIKFYEFGSSNRALPPSAFKGYSISSNTAHLEWKSNAFYFYIYRGTDRQNLQLYDSTFTISYQDNGLSDSTFFYYSVQAVDPTKPEPFSALSEIIEIYAHTPSRMIGVTNNSRNSLIVTFSERVNNTIQDLLAFELKNFGYPNSITSASQKSYLLTFKSELPSDINTLILHGLTDFYNSPIVKDSINFNVIIQQEAATFIIASHEIINPFRIKVTFNLPIDPVSAGNPDNYIFHPENKVASVEFDNSDPNTIYLNLDRRKPIGSVGIQYRLKIENLLSTAATGNLKIASESGSYIVLVSFAQDLSDIYVYPSPVKLGASSKITFANLPQKAKIVIFSLTGMKINEIEESDGDGGVDYNLTDFNNELIGTGIYIFRIIRLDINNNEVEEKLGKFAVIRE